MSDEEQKYHESLLEEKREEVRRRTAPPEASILEEILQEMWRGLSDSLPDDVVNEATRKVMNAEKKIEAYISKHYIKKEDVLEAVGAEEDNRYDSNQAIYTYTLEYSDGVYYGRNELRAEIKEKLNLGDK